MKFSINQHVMYHKKGKQMKQVQVIDIKKKYKENVNKETVTIKKGFFAGLWTFLDCVSCNQFVPDYMHIYHVIDKDYNRYEATEAELMPMYKKTVLII